MNTLLEKLDRQAGCWLQSLDRGLHLPIVRVITGQVFVNAGLAHGRNEPNTTQHATGSNTQTQELNVYRSSIAAELKQQECGSAA